MATREFRNAPNLSGWAIAAGMGLVAVAVAIVVGEFRYTIAGFIGALVTVAAGLVMGMPWGAKVPEPVKAMPKPAVPMPAPVAAPMAAPVMAAPVAAPVMPAPVAAPVMAAPLMAAPAAPAEDAMPSVAGAPLRLNSPRGGKADDLKEIEGIGPAMEKLCNELGFYHFDQIAAWTDAQVAWVDENMKTFKGRIVRDKWVAQARLIVSEGLEAFRIRAKTNDY